MMRGRRGDGPEPMSVRDDRGCEECREMLRELKIEMHCMAMTLGDIRASVDAIHRQSNARSMPSLRQLTRNLPRYLPSDDDEGT